MGCPEPVLPAGTYAKYEEGVVFIFCNGSGDSFLLKCVDKVWKGNVQNCTPVGKDNSLSQDYVSQGCCVLIGSG